MRLVVVVWSGLASMVVGCKFPPPPDVPSDDGGGVDAPDDGAAEDASVDATLPIVANNQPADLVLGAADFVTAGRTGFSAISVLPWGLATDGNVLWVNDRVRSRILGWEPLPTSNDQPANRVLGRPSLIDNSPADSISMATVGEAWIWPTSDMLIVSDGMANRLMIWDPPPTTNGERADRLVGQTSETATGGGYGPGQLRGPEGVWTDGTRLAVADTFNHRVLLWTSFPTTPTEAADVVLGQNGFNNPVLSPTDASAMAYPRKVLFDGTRLYVVDSLHHRVLIWYGLPTVNNQPASVVLGQPDATSDSPGTGPGRMNEPRDIAVVGDALFVADSLNNRVLVFKPIPSTTGAPATYVLGQPDLSSVVGNNPPPSQTNMSEPSALAIAGNKLFVADLNRSRVLRFHINP